MMNWTPQVARDNKPNARYAGDDVILRAVGRGFTTGSKIAAIEYPDSLVSVVALSDIKPLRRSREEVILRAIQDAPGIGSFVSIATIIESALVKWEAEA